MYAQTCTRPNISFAINRYQSNPGLDHLKATKKVLRYLQGTKNHMLTYRRYDNLEVIEYTDSNYFWLYRESLHLFMCIFGQRNDSVKSAKQLVIVASTV